MCILNMWVKKSKWEKSDDDSVGILFISSAGFKGLLVMTTMNLCIQIKLSWVGKELSNDHGLSKVDEKMKDWYI